jgi:putative ABC transport system permease protein
MLNLFKDLRYSLRVLWKRPTFTIIAVLTIALGVGANTTIFTCIYAVALKPLPFHDPDKLMMIYLMSPEESQNKEINQPWSFAKYEVLRDYNQSFDQVASFSKQEFTLEGGLDPERIVGEYVSQTYFPLLQVNSRLGRTFTPEEDKTPSANPVAIMGHGLWQRKFGNDQSLQNKTVTVNNTVLTIIGVMPPEFKGLSGQAELWVPNMMAPTLIAPDQLTEPFVHWMDAVGRLKSTGSLAQAKADMGLISKKINETIQGPPGFESGDVGLVSLRESKVDPAIRKSFLLLFLAVILVLLIACVNTANLLLTRLSFRKKEIAIRIALGAKRSRLIRLLLSESLTIAFLGGLVGLLIAYFGLQFLELLKPADNPASWARNFRILEFNSLTLGDGAILAFNFAVALIPGLIFGLLPLLQPSFFTIGESLKESAIGPSEGMDAKRHIGPRSFLVIAEVALSVTLLIGAGLMIKSFSRLQSVNTGFNASNILTFKLDTSKYDRQGAWNFNEQLISRISALSGVESAAVTRSLPLASNAGGTDIAIEGLPPAAPGTGPVVGYHIIGPNYFSALRIPVLYGRAFDDRDRADSSRKAVISEDAAKAFWPGESPLGKRFRLSLGWRPGDWAEVVGVVGDVKYGDIESPVRPEIYLSFLQNGQRPAYVLVRTDKNPLGIIPAVRSEVKALNPDLPIYELKSMEQRISDATSKSRLSSLLFSIFAAIALTLSAIGIYGVMAYRVAGRTREIGIRMAFGAQTGDILKLVMRDGVLLVGIGLALGLAAAFAARQIISSQLYGISSADPIVFGLASIVLAAVALTACYIPARRATKVDPMIALRFE